MNLKYILSICLIILLTISCKNNTPNVKDEIDSSKSDTSNYPPPGEIVDIGGYKLHLLVEGKGQTGPTIVFFHGAGDIALNWNLVLPQVGEFATAVAIDQSGEGWSDFGHGASLFQQVYDSHKVLKVAGYEAPYILVGHSLGGILANIYAKEYPSEVAGVVMVDATHPDVLLNVFNKESNTFEWKVFRTTASDTIPSVVTTPLVNKPVIGTFQPKKDFGEMLDKFSEYDSKLFNWIYNERPWPYVKGYHDYEAEIFTVMHNQKTNYFLDNVPVIILTGGQKEYSEGDENWTAEKRKIYSDSLQLDLLNLSTNSKQIIAENSGHHIHIDEPQIVIKAVRQLVRKLKNANKK
jgi:pimeloyl-ACP methyl ester carboxylesterase